MARKRAPGGGRKREGAAPKEHFNTRLAPELREQLQQIADRKKITLSRYVGFVLKEAMKPLPEPELCAFARAFVEAARYLRGGRKDGAKPFDWRHNRADFEAVRAAILRLLDEYAPQGQPDADQFTDYGSPEDAGRAAASFAIALLRTTEPDLTASGDRGARGQLWLTLPEAAAYLYSEGGES